MSKPFPHLALAAALASSGCAYAAKQTTYTDPKTGETYVWSSASDGRSWVERHPLANGVVGFVDLCAKYPTRTAQYLFEHWDWNDSEEDPNPNPKDNAKATAAKEMPAVPPAPETNLRTAVPLPAPKGKSEKPTEKPSTEADLR